MNIQYTLPVTNIAVVSAGGSEHDWKILGRLHSRDDIWSEFPDWYSHNEKRGKDIPGRGTACARRWQVEMRNGIKGEDVSFQVIDEGVILLQIEEYVTVDYY